MAAVCCRLWSECLRCLRCAESIAFGCTANAVVAGVSRTFSVLLWPLSHSHMCRVSLTFNALRQNRREHAAIAISDANSMIQLMGSNLFSASITFSIMSNLILHYLNWRGVRREGLDVNRT